ITTGSWCFTEILMSRKPCSSNSEHSHSALSTSASGVARPCFSSSRLSSDPALTPIRIGVPAAAAACAISLTLSSNCLMLPGLTRTAAQPASMAAKTYFGWKWMSAITGICECLAISGSASASSWLGQATRTIWHPDAVSSAICCSVALTSAVNVVVIDCTEIGAPPPIFTPPTSICRVGRRGARGWTGTSGIPSDTAVTVSTFPSRRRAYLLDADRVDDARIEQQQGQPDEDRNYSVGERHDLHQVDAAGVSAPEQPVEPGTALLEQHDGHVATVERQQRKHVEDTDEEVELRHDRDQVCQAHAEGDLRLRDLPADAGDVHHARGACCGARLAVEDLRHLMRQVAERTTGLDGHLPQRREGPRHCRGNAQRLLALQRRDADEADRLPGLLDGHRRQRDRQLAAVAPHRQGHGTART